MAHALRLHSIAFALILALVVVRDAGANPTPDPAAQARAQALIDSTENGATAFRTGPSGEVTHIQSGMVCPRSDQLMSLTHLFVHPGVPTGDDVGCDYVTSEGKMTIFASRRGALTLDAYSADIVNGIVQLYPSARPIEGPVIIYAARKPVAAAFSITTNGARYITSVWITESRDWFVETRATFPENPADPLEMLAALISVSAQRTIDEYEVDQAAPDSSVPRLRPRSADD